MIRRSFLFVAVAAVISLALSDHAGEAPGGKVLFEDHFDGKLGEGWSWVYEDKDNWRIHDGKLQIRATGGSSFMKEHDGRNYLLRTPPASKTGEIAIEVYVENKPTEHWEHAGLLWFYDDDHYVILNKEHVWEAGVVNVLFMVEKDGKPVGSGPEIHYKGEGVWLRFRVAGTHIVGEYRATAAEPWHEVGAGELPEKGPPLVGVHAGYSPKKDLERWSSFSHFKITEVEKEKK